MYLQFVMQALGSKIAGLNGKNSSLKAIEAAVYVCNNAKGPFGVQLIVQIEFLFLIAAKLPEADELLPFFKVAIHELSVACFQKDYERHGIKYALSLYRATIVSCEAMKVMMSKDFMVAISLIPCTCMPEYFDSVSAMSTLTDEERLNSIVDARTREQAVASACMEICAVVQEELRK